MAINFPNSPQAGDPHSEAGIDWVYDGEKWVAQSEATFWARAGSTLSPSTAGDNISTTGDLSASAGTFSDDVIVSSTGANRGFPGVATPSFLAEGTDFNGSTQLIANNSTNSHGIIAFGRSRGGMGSFTSVSQDDTLGRIDFYGATGAAYELGATIQGRIQGVPSAGTLTTALDFNTNNGSSVDRRMTLTPGGDVRIGGTLPASPNIRLDTTGFGKFYTPGKTTGNESVLNCNSDSGGTDVVIVSIRANGDIRHAGSLVPTSDQSLKENIADAKSQWGDVKAIKLRNYTWINSPEKGKMLGVIAQEVEQISPGLVSEDENGIKGFKLDPLVMKMLGALQEAQARIEALEAEVQALKGGI